MNILFEFRMCYVNGNCNSSYSSTLVNFHRRREEFWTSCSYSLLHQRNGSEWFKSLLQQMLGYSTQNEALIPPAVWRVDILWLLVEPVTDNFPPSKSCFTQGYGRPTPRHLASSRAIPKTIPVLELLIRSAGASLVTVSQFTYSALSYFFNPSLVLFLKIYLNNMPQKSLGSCVGFLGTQSQTIFFSSLYILTFYVTSSIFMDLYTIFLLLTTKFIFLVLTSSLISKCISPAAFSIFLLQGTLRNWSEYTQRKGTLYVCQMLLIKYRN